MFLKIITMKITLRVTFNISLFPPFSRYCLKYNKVLYHFYTFLVTNKVYHSFKQISGFTEAIKQKKTVKVYLPPPNGHGDCVTDLEGK